MSSQISVEDACLSCGACCASFRVSFYGAEAAHIPLEMVEDVNALYACMVGTNQQQPRCVALQGEIGKQVSCSIYSARSSTCKEVKVTDEQCVKARKAHQLIPLVNEDLIFLTSEIMLQNEINNII